MRNEEITYSVEEGFSILVSNLEITESERAEVTARQLEIESYLARYIDTFVTQLPGAFARRTMIAPLKAGVVDMLVLLQQQHSKKYKPSELLEKLYVTLKSPYPDIEKCPDGRGIFLGFPECRFKIMPGFFFDDGGYLVPTVNGRDWIRSDPEHYQRQLEQADRESKGQLLPVIKMLKCWNRSIDHIFHGYYLELLAMEVIKDALVSSHISAIRHVLDKGKMKLVFTAEDPAVDCVLLDGLRDMNTLVHAMLCFQNAYAVSAKAVHHERRKNIKQAFLEWDSLFPGYFPTPVSMVIHKLQQANVEGARALEIMRDSI